MGNISTWLIIFPVYNMRLMNKYIFLIIRFIKNINIVEILHY